MSTIPLNDVVALIMSDKSTAIHEIGHAIYFHLNGFKFDIIEIQGKGEGCVKYGVYGDYHDWDWLLEHSIDKCIDEDYTELKEYTEGWLQCDIAGLLFEMYLLHDGIESVPHIIEHILDKSPKRITSRYIDSRLELSKYKNLEMKRQLTDVECISLTVSLFNGLDRSLNTEFLYSIVKPMITYIEENKELIEYLAGELETKRTLKYDEFINLFNSYKKVA